MALGLVEFSTFHQMDNQVSPRRLEKDANVLAHLNAIDRDLINGGRIKIHNLLYMYFDLIIYLTLNIVNDIMAPFNKGSQKKWKEI